GEKLTDLPGIGKDLAAQIDELVRTGRSTKLEELQSQVPAGLVELMALPGLGPKKVKVLHDTLNITSIAELTKAAKEGRLKKLPGFGEKIEQSILKSIPVHAEHGKRVKLATAAQYAEPLAEYLRGIAGVTGVVIAGSYRRCKETLGDIDILVTAGKTARVM